MQIYMKLKKKAALKRRLSLYLGQKFKMGKNSRIKRRSCKKKIPFKTQTLAVAALINLRKENYNGHTYKCRFCKNWHIGRTPKYVKRIIRQRQKQKV